jgi:hypothetical protein
MVRRTGAPITGYGGSIYDDTDDELNALLSARGA